MDGLEMEPDSGCNDTMLDGAIPMQERVSTMQESVSTMQESVSTMQESVSTLGFADRAKQVRLRAKVNEEIDDKVSLCRATRHGEPVPCHGSEGAGVRHD